MSRAAFGPAWLATRLAALIPGFPRVAVCVAYSGGADSTALLAGLAALRTGRRGLRLRAVHVDHGLHPESRRWADSCVAAAARWRVPIEVRAVHVPRRSGESLEASARDARYACFERELGAGEYLLTAHHLDDQAETVLLQLLRGSGVAGLAAMPALAPFARGWLARPLLALDRAALRDWLTTKRIDYSDDPANDDARFDRNALRHEIMPAIVRRWPGAVSAFARSASHAAAAKRRLDREGRLDADAAADGESLSVTRLRVMSADRRANAVRAWLQARGVAVPDTRRLAEIIGPLIDARGDASPHVQLAGYRVHRHDERLSVRAQSDAKTARAMPATPATPAARAWRWHDDRVLRLDDAGAIELVGDPHGPIDLARLPPVLTLRSRAGGERLRVRAGGPRRALKALLQEARVSPWERCGMPLIFAEDALIAAGDRWHAVEIAADRSSVSRARIVWHRSPAVC